MEFSWQFRYGCGERMKYLHTNPLRARNGREPNEILSLEISSESEFYKMITINLPYAVRLANISRHSGISAYMHFASIVIYMVTRLKIENGNFVH